MIAARLVLSQCPAPSSVTGRLISSPLRRLRLPPSWFPVIPTFHHVTVAALTRKLASTSRTIVRRRKSINAPMPRVVALEGQRLKTIRRQVAMGGCGMIGEKSIRFKQPNAQDERERNVTTRSAGDPALPAILSKPRSASKRQSAVYGLNGRRVSNVISLSIGTYESTIQRSRNFHALFTGTLEDCFQLMRTAVLIHPPKTDETRAPSRGNRGLPKRSEKRSLFRTRC